MNISDLKDYKIVSAPAAPPTSGAITNISQLGNNYQTSSSPQVSTSQSSQNQTPLLSKQSSSFGDNLNTALGDTIVGAGKSFVRGARGVASEVQNIGKNFLSGVTGLPTPSGIASIDNSTPSGARVNQQLQNTSRAQQVGGALETVGELGAGFASSEGTAAIQKAKQGYDAFKEARGAKLADQEFKDVAETVKPKLTPTQEAEAKAAGRGTTRGGLSNKATILPSTQETEMTKYAHEAGVSSNNTFDKNIQFMKDAQKTSAQNLRAGLQNAKGTWSRNDVVGALNEIKTPLTIKSDATLTRLANNFKTAIVDLTANTAKKPEGLLDLRQGVDDLISKEFPSNIYSKDTPVGQYVRKVRQALNGMAESKLPEGKLPSGTTFRDELRRQTLLYDAIDNVAAKAPKEGESARPIVQKTKAFAKAHPYITTGAVGEVGHRIITGRF